MATSGLYGNSGTGNLVAAPGTQTPGLYGKSPNGSVLAQPGSETSGLYGNNTVFGGTYFEWFIFQEAATQPATPTGGSWSFTSNTGTPPSGWSLLPPSAPVNQVWVSIALVNSRSDATLAWTAPGLFGVVPNFTFPTPITGAPGTDAAVVNVGTATNPSLQFTIPRGDTGAQGPQGPAGTAATVTAGTTTTGAAGTSASVVNSGTTSAAVFDFTIPRGDTGATGATGAKGDKGDTGDAATIAVGTTTTGSPGTSATVTNSGTSGAAVFDFTIPRGDVGATGPTGATGATGAAATISVGTTTTTSPGTSASVTNSGTSGAAIFDFSIPRGAGVNAGGTTGQVLAKASNTDYDTSWINVVGGLNYQGTWNASTNTPTLTSSTGVNGYYYIVSVAGTTNLDGITDWSVGDWAIFNGSTWQKIDQSNLVTSVNGQTGTVVLDAADVGALSDVTSTDGSVTITTPTAGVRDLSVAVAAATNNVLVQVRNTTGATLTKGTVVYISGATGQLPTVTKAIATSDGSSAQTLGMMTADLANNSNGNVTVIGLITDIDTSAYADGAQLYLSGTTAGGVTTTKPYAPTHLVYIGIVEYSHAVHGKIFVKVQNGYELEELHNVSAQTPTTGQTIVYNSSTSLWEQSNSPVISGTTIDSTTIGATTPSTGAFTTLTAPNPEASNGIFVNSQTIATSYTIATGKSGMSSGPVSIASGQSVTISSGSRWVVV